MPARMLRLLDRTALAATLVLPLFFMHGRGIAEALIGIIDVAFLARCALARDWSWLRATWVRVAIVWWLWLILCSLPGIGIGGEKSLVQAIVMVRFLLFVAALEHAVLATAAARRWLQHVLTASALYIAGQTWLQLASGTNLGGYPRHGDGELTGPFQHPRAAAPLSRLLFPTMLPWLINWLTGPAATRLAAARFAAAGLAIAGVGTVVLIGQRMPMLLTLFGLVVAAFLLPRLRLIAATAIAAGAILLAASVIVSPPTFYRLVTKFSAQMSNFPNSDYGLIAARAIIITADHPLFGQGFDGFRNACPNPAFHRGWALAGEFPDGGGVRICNIHPHNHYLEAATNAGIPGLLLFSALVLAWLRALGRNLDADPLRVGLFVAALIQEWPIASASGFSAVEIAGFFFLLLGYGLALSRAASSTAPTSPSGAIPST